MTIYTIEIWNPKTNRYSIAWEGPKEYALTMMNKRYNHRHTRRLIKTTKEILIKIKKNNYISGVNLVKK